MNKNNNTSINGNNKTTAGEPSSISTQETIANLEIQITDTNTIVVPASPKPPAPEQTSINQEPVAAKQTEVLSTPLNQATSTPVTTSSNSNQITSTSVQEATPNPQPQVHTTAVTEPTPNTTNDDIEKPKTKKKSKLPLILIIIVLLIIAGYNTYINILPNLTTKPQENKVKEDIPTEEESEEEVLLVNNISFNDETFNPIDITLNKINSLGYHLDYDGHNYYIDETKNEMSLSTDRTINDNLITKDNYNTKERIMNNSVSNDYDNLDYYLVLEGNKATDYDYNSDIGIKAFNGIKTKIYNWNNGKEADYKDSLIASIDFGYLQNLDDLTKNCNEVGTDAALLPDTKLMCIDNKDIHIQAMEKVINNYPKIVIDDISLGDSKEKVTTKYSDIEDKVEDNGDLRSSIKYHNKYQSIEFYFYNEKVIRISYSWTIELFKEKELVTD